MKEKLISRSAAAGTGVSSIFTHEDAGFFETVNSFALLVTKQLFYRNQQGKQDFLIPPPPGKRCKQFLQ
jgi:hypothetical protein